MDDLERMYQQVILDHAKMRRGSGTMDDAHGESFQVNPTCGDQVLLKVRLAPDGRTIEQIAWDGQGCSISQASLSLMWDLTNGGTVGEAEELGELFREMMHSRGDFDEDKLDRLEDASALIGVSRFSARVKCALLGWMALRAALTEALAATPKENE